MYSQTDFIESPLPEYVAGRILSCSESECRVFRKSFFRQVKVRAYVGHKKIVWICPSCHTKQVISSAGEYF
jgi:hypothetical protein